MLTYYFERPSVLKSSEQEAAFDEKGWIALRKYSYIQSCLAGIRNLIKVMKHAGRIDMD